MVQIGIIVRIVFIARNDTVAYIAGDVATVITARCYFVVTAITFFVIVVVLECTCCTV
jgi:hypothetical protein